MFAAACMSIAAAAQVTVISGQAVDQYGAPLPFAQVRVCNAATSSGTPCTPTATIYTNYALSGAPASNPYSADQYGNYTLYAGPLAAPNLYVVQLSPASGITWSYVTAGQTCGPTGCTAGLFNATISPYFEIDGVQITSGALSDHANIAYLNVANVFTASPQTAPIFNATTQFNVAGTQIASANLSDGANLAKLNASNTFTGTTNTFATVNATAYQVAGVALAASNLSNGVSGTGAVCLASGSACTISIAANGTGQTQRPTLNFSPRFALTDSSSPAETTVDLATAGTAGTYTYPASITTDVYGRLTAVSGSSASITTTSTAGTILNAGSGCVSSPFTAAGKWYQFGGIYYETVTGTQQSDCSSEPNNGQESIALPHTCPTAIFSVAVTNLAPSESGSSSDDTAQATQSLVSINTTTVVTQRYRAADHGGSPSTPVITVICN